MSDRAAERDFTFSLAALPSGPLAWPNVNEGPAAYIPAPGGQGRVLIGGVGYQHLGGFSFGPLLVDALRDREWPADVVIDDVSFGPIDVLFKLQAEPEPFRLAVLAGATERGRPPGTVEVGE